MMSTDWIWLLLACAVAFVTKLAGYLVPPQAMSGPRMARVTALVTVGLLAALVVSNTLADGQKLVVDARVGALAVAIVALLLCAPFLLVVIAGAATAALLRSMGIG